MLTFALGLIVGLLINALGIWNASRKLKSVQEQQKLIFDRELGDRIGPEEFEKLAHAVNALKQLENVGVVDKESFPGARRIIEEADKVVLENKFCPGWYRS